MGDFDQLSEIPLTPLIRSMGSILGETPPSTPLSQLECDETLEDDFEVKIVEQQQPTNNSSPYVSYYKGPLITTNPKPSKNGTLPFKNPIYIGTNITKPDILPTQRLISQDKMNLFQEKIDELNRQLCASQRLLLCERKRLQDEFVSKAKHEWCSVGLSDCVFTSMHKDYDNYFMDEPAKFCTHRLTICAHPICIDCINKIKEAAVSGGITINCHHCIRLGANNKIPRNLLFQKQQYTPGTILGDNFFRRVGENLDYCNYYLTNHHNPKLCTKNYDPYDPFIPCMEEVDRVAMPIRGPIIIENSKLVSVAGGSALKRTISTINLLDNVSTKKQKIDDESTTTVDPKAISPPQEQKKKSKT